MKGYLENIMRYQNLLQIIFIIFVVSSCAKKRPVEPVYDLDSSRWSKGVFENGKDWLYKVTIVKNGANGDFGFVGLQSDMRLGKFRFTEDRLEFVSSIDIYGRPQTTEKVVNSWSGSHSEYHRAVVGGKVSNVQSENDTIAWNEKNFFKVDWTSAAISERDSFGYGTSSSCFSKLASRRVPDSEEISAEHITFTVAVDYKYDLSSCFNLRKYLTGDETVTVHFKYSFIPDKPGSTYKPYVYTSETDPLMKKYGYFNTFVGKVGDDNRQVNTFLMNRWDTEKTHIFYFAEGFPDKYKAIYNDPETGIFAKTNQLLQENGIPTRFEIKENTGQEFGDLRYSFIKFIEEPEGSAPLGYGPSDAHPLTGEIIAANSMIWTSGLKYYAKIYRDEAAATKKLTETSSLQREMADILGSGPIQWNATANFLEDNTLSQYYRYLLPEFTYGRRGNYYTFEEDPYLKIFPKGYYDNLLEKVNINPQMIEMHKKSEETIKQQLLHYSQMDRRNNNATTVYRLEEAIAASGGLHQLIQEVDDDTIINDILYRVAIHEFGHNLNLRHNFYGSVDAKISRSPGEDLSQKRTSSVMDYLAISDEVGLPHDWDDYDRAALVFAYSNGETDLAKQKGYNYLYCTDEHRALNPLCNAYDQGATPTEVISSLITRYDLGYQRLNFRYGRAFWDTRYYENAAFGTMFDIKKMVKLYQETFLPSQVGNELTGLSFVDEATVNTVTAEIREDITEATKLAAAFYSSIVKQGSLDRPFTNSYDDFTGEIKQLGIWPDKYYAKFFLMGDASFPLNPNFGEIPVSFVNLRSDPNIGGFIDQVLFDTFVNSGDGYVGYDTIGRIFYSRNASNFFDFEGSQSAIDLMKVECYKPESFNTAFGVDPTGLANGSNTLTPDYGAATKPDIYFSDKGQINVIEINNELYVSAVENNKYAAGVIDTNDLNGVLIVYILYKQATRGEVERCQ